MNDVADVLAWLRTNPDLDALRSRFPDEWRDVEREMASAASERSVARLDLLLMRTDGPDAVGLPGGRKRKREHLRQVVRRRMAILALRRLGSGLAETADGDGAAPGRWSRALTDGLFLDRAGAKKAVSVRVFRLAWPFVRRKGAFLAQAQAKGTYCFLSSEIVDALAVLAAGRRCIEIAAGDGTLTRFLLARGVDVVAIDDGSWSADIAYPDFVRRMDAVEALRALQPEVVFCSWPPPGNAFERSVFATPSVGTYVVIGSRHRFATGARDDYEAETRFSRRVDPILSALVLPPEAGNEVLIFERFSEADLNIPRLVQSHTVL